jgi:type III pantothenate kinase
MMLLVDVGNTRAKWAVLADGRLSGTGAVLHRGVPAADWVHGLDGAAAGCKRILVSNVAGPAVAHAIGEWALSRHGFRPEFVRATREAGGIRNAYEHPEALGPDRWCGMIGAWRRARGPLVCIAAGTAMTIDVVDAAGAHLGGLIVPGHDLMIDSLLRRTSDIAPAAQAAPPAGSGMLGRNTAAAIELGASHALAALAVRSIDWVSGLVGTPPRVFLGGGDASRIEPLLGVGVEVTSGLVLEGLAVIAEGDG